MSYRKQRLPTAGAEFKWFCETYGSVACDTASRWTNALVAAASIRNDKKIGASHKLADLIDSMLSDDPQKTTRREYVTDKFKKSPLSDKLRAILHFLRHRSSPWESYVAVREITCLGVVPLEIYAYYEVDHIEKRVIFTKFDHCGMGGESLDD